MDAVVEVRDIRIPLSTTHPDIPKWVGDKQGNLTLVPTCQLTTPVTRSSVATLLEMVGS